MLDGVTISLHYSRAGQPVSSRKTRDFPFLRNSAASAAVVAVAVLAPLAAWSQYPGQVTKDTKSVPVLRAVAVLEWTGEAGKPKACRIVPVTVFDGEKLQDGGIYLARPQPLALTSDVEYELKMNDKSIGLFDVKTAGQEQGGWVGHGDWKPMPKPKAETAPMLAATDDEYSDRPVLHRKHHADDAPSASGKGTGSSSGASSAPAEPSDPDRPTLHKHDSGQSTTSTEPGPDPDRPTLHQKNSDSAGGSDSAPDPDRPTIKKSRKAPEDVGHADSVADATDPDRPLLKRGKSSGSGAAIAPTLMGLPPDMQQAIAVSDPRNRPDHPWTYSWASPDDEEKMKSALEDIAREALGLSTPPPAPKPVPRRTAAATRMATRKAAKPAPPPPPVPLEGEQFRVFELAYGSGATMVLTAHTAGSLADEKFLTLIAQPDLYGNVLVLLKNVGDGAHLDDTPRMRLVDAVDALADNRGELLFELRGQTSRQFALYRVLRGTAEKLFVSGGGFFGSATSE
jgi:hypothetical protein